MRGLPSPGGELRRQIEDKREELASHWANRAWRAVRPVLGWALWVMLLVLVTPPALKAFWFFAVAPLASRLRPIRIGRPGSGEAFAGPMSVSPTRTRSRQAPSPGGWSCGPARNCSFGRNICRARSSAATGGFSTAAEPLPALREPRHGPGRAHPDQTRTGNQRVHFRNQGPDRRNRRARNSRGVGRRLQATQPRRRRQARRTAPAPGTGLEDRLPDVLADASA